MVLLIIIIRKFGISNALRFIFGGIIFIIPSLLYYFYDTQTLLKIIGNQAAIGGHCNHIESFHFFFLIANIFKGFEAWYIGNKIWFFLSMLGIPISLLLYKLKRVNFIQCLALSYAFVTIFAPEPFRLEPLIGLLWLDAVFRESIRMQTFIFITLLIHSAAWYDIANSTFLIFDPATPYFLWIGKGLYLGMSVIIMFLIVVFEKEKKDLILPYIFKQ
jgi:hypothetical protein